MKKILTYVAALGALICANACYDDSAVNERIDALEDRFDKLEVLVNTDIANLQKLVTSLQGVVTVVSVTPTANGYDVVLSDGTKMTITNGKDGANGKDGVNGTNGKDGKDGKDGADGKDGESTVVGITEIDGVYYWTLDGKLVKDGEGKNIPVSAGAPEFKIEDGDWYVTYDKGLSWVKVAGSNGTALSFFKDVTVTKDEVVFTLADGSSFALPILKEFGIELQEDIVYIPGTAVTVPYVVTGADAAKVFCIADGPFTAAVQTTSATAGKIVITPESDEAFGQVIVFAVNGNLSVVKCISLEKSVILVEEAFAAERLGGNVEIPVITNLDYTVEADSWITYVETKAVRSESVIVKVAANTYGQPKRVGKVQIVAQGKVVKEVAIVQEGSVMNYYPTYKAQTIDPSKDLVAYAAATPTTTADWITVGADGKLSIAANTGIVRKGEVKYGKEVLYVTQNPGNAFLDFYFEGANGTLAATNNKVTNAGTASALTANFYATGNNANYAYSKPLTVDFDQNVGHKVLSCNNTQSPCNYGPLLWRNANGTTVTSMNNGFTVEVLVAPNYDVWNQAKYSESNIFCFKTNVTAAGSKAIGLGLYNVDASKTAFSFIFSNSRVNGTTTYVTNSDYHHVAATYDKTAKKVYIYVDGVLAGSKDETRDASSLLATGTAKGSGIAGGTPCNPWILGGYLNIQYNILQGNYAGKIANCRVYGKTLTAAEIEESAKILLSGIQK